MTIRLARATELGYDDVIIISGHAVAVRTVKKSVLTYRGVSFPVVYVGGVTDTSYGRTSTVLLAGAELFAARRTA